MEVVMQTKKGGKNEGDCEAISHSPQGKRELSVGK